MFKNYWTIAWRMLVRNKIYTLVNVAGLALGICACLVIWVIVHYEFSFDRDHPDGARIYRINSFLQFMKDQPEQLQNGVVVEMPEAVRTGIPGVATVAPYYPLSQWTATVAGAGERKADFSGMPVVAGPDYFRVMHYDWIAGDPGKALASPFGVVLTKKRARQFFGPGQPQAFIGREVIYNDSLAVHVTGIVRDWTEHTDFPYTDFISFSTIDHSWLRQYLGLDDSRGMKFTPVLIKLAPEANPANVDTAITVLFNRKWRNRLFSRVEMQPLSTIHFTAGAGDQATIRTTQLSTLYALLGIAIFILSLAIVNYVNLATAQSLTREKEISIRKVMGSGKSSLLIQLLSETFLLTSLAGVVAVLSVRPVLGAFRQFVPETIQFDPLAPANWLFLLAITMLITLLAGLYPARILSSRSPVAALKGNGAPKGGGKWWLRESLIVFQFTVSLLFIIGATVIGRQIGFMMHKDLGFRTDAIVRFDTGEAGDSTGNVKILEQEIRQLPGVADIASENIPPMGPDKTITTVRYPVTSEVRIPAQFVRADEHYIPLYGIRLLAGRNLFPSDTVKEVVINETLSRQLGFRNPEEAVGKTILNIRKTLPIVGVVADFHEYSYQEPIEPLLIMGATGTDLAVRLDTRGRSAAEAHAILNRIGRTWKTVYPHKLFEFSFIDDWIALLYRREQTMEGLMHLATGITIFISLTGLFGLTLFTTGQRTREIGIRKVLGARVTDILILLGRDFVRLVLLALLISSAAGWWLTHRWLQGYAYRVGIGVDVFLLAGRVLMLITVLTVGLQSLKAALVNPVESLHNE
jgi:putative ABC transport system permease protein